MHNTTHAVIYHYWHKRDCLSLDYPIIVSIATLRAQNASIPIYVLDCSRRTVDWKEFPRTLNFTVVPWRFRLPRKRFRGLVLWEHSSKAFDLPEFAEKIEQSKIIFCDSDVFWLRNPLPLASEAHIDRFCCRPENTGFFYFDKHSSAVKEFIKLWQATIVAAIYDMRIRKSIWTACRLDQSTKLPLHEEMVHYYVRNDRFAFDIPMAENQRLKPGVTENDLKDAKNLHIMQVFWPGKRGLIGLHIRELLDSMKNTLDSEQLRLLFGSRLPTAADLPVLELAKPDVYESLRRLID